MPEAPDQSTVTDEIQPANTIIKRPRNQLRIDKIQRAFRRFGRIYNPFTDATGGMLLAYNILIPPPATSGQFFDYLIAFTATSTLLLPSAAYEIYSSLQLSKDSPFAYGQSDTHQLLRLQEELSLILGSHVAGYSLLDLINLLHQPHLKHRLEVTRLIEDFHRVRTYNHLRKLANNLNITLLSGAAIISLDNFLTNLFHGELRSRGTFPTGVIILFSMVALLFILKSGVDHLEYYWERYEPYWKKLPLRFKKGFIVLRNLVDFGYNLGFAMDIAALGSAALIMGLFDLARNVRNFDLYKEFPASWIFEGTIMYFRDLGAYAGLLFGSLPAFTYAIVQQIPTYTQRYDKPFVHKLKRSSQTLFQSARAYSALFFTLAICHFFVFLNLPDNTVTDSIGLITAIALTLIAILGGITAGSNAWMNYKERDSKKFSVIDNEVETLRQALLDEERAFSSSYGTVESEETHFSSNPTTTVPATAGPKTKARNVYSWPGFFFWQPSDQKGNIKRTTPLSDVPEIQKLT
jgi:hypothetical protein